MASCIAWCLMLAWLALASLPPCFLAPRASLLPCCHALYVYCLLFQDESSSKRVKMQDRALRGQNDQIVDFAAKMATSCTCLAVAGSCVVWRWVWLGLARFGSIWLS